MNGIASLFGNLPAPTDHIARPMNGIASLPNGRSAPTVDFARPMNGIASLFGDLTAVKNRSSVVEIGFIRMNR